MLTKRGRYVNRRRRDHIGSLYIHIPFCLRKCPYCDFFSIPYETEIENRYVSALRRELTLRKDEIGTLKTIYIGGGTPSVFEAGSIARLLEFINNNFTIEGSAELTLEVNPSSVDDEKLRSLRQAGINRISMGVQSFDNAELKSLGRLHDSQGAANALDIIKKYFVNFSIDLIYGLEGQSTSCWIRNIRTALSFSPPHISAYELTPEEGTPFGRRVKSGQAALPCEDDIAAMYDSAAELFNSAGLCHYEISNFAAEGFQCRHNQNYWRREFYTGIGAGAHSHLNIPAGKPVRSSNVADVEQYLTAVEHDTLPVYEHMIIDSRERLKEDIFLGLRTSEGIHIDKLAGITISGLIENGLATLDESSFRLTRKGFLVSNRIIGSLIDQL
ncbi:radical SAM family heme chaperone HemW [Candidatus Magnetominusculus xianensis]|uniref:Heme chaperone HemW n=1 Tax=Candidatus Magnetominusculus xianensis TaxID=1748249 RepID=A0ABR5SEA3_9BACT|nr:radical SAM family heme chaperone HemW [Candidatus Magnetominusculus xianensis]KWT82798.1 oxygen-independent coproporphyrinogen-III oxidase [Candidatus Magnetominusculus xianensis]MBF0403486.1 radical SAM family heme chaperone HemW [Nitrospirota bacterium]